MGMTPCGMAKPCPCSRKKRMTPSAAARPKALPPASSRPCTVSTWDSGRMSSVSRQPGAKPGTAMPGVKPCGQRMAVQPVWFRSSVAWPASRPSMAVRVVLLMETPVAEVGGCPRAAMRLRSGWGTMGRIFHVRAKKESFPLQGMPVRSTVPGRGGKPGQPSGQALDAYRAGARVFGGGAEVQEKARAFLYLSTLPWKEQSPART